MFSRVAVASFRRLAVRPAVVLPRRTFASYVPLARSSITSLADIVKSEHDVAVEIENELAPQEKEYLSKSGFLIHDNKFESTVEMRKTLPSGEELRVFFDIDEVSDISLNNPELTEDAEAAEMAEEDGYDEGLDQFDNVFANIKVLVSKPQSNDGLFFNLMLQNSEGDLYVEYFNYKPDVKKFLAEVAEKGTFLGTSEYQGPQFSNLDEALQMGLESYLEEQGVNSDLAEFIFSYSEIKEEESYRNLLANTAAFLTK